MGHLGLFHHFIQVAREKDEISEFQQYYLYTEGIFPELCCALLWLWQHSSSPIPWTALFFNLQAALCNRPTDCSGHRLSKCWKCVVFSDVCAIDTTCAVSGRWSATGDFWSRFCHSANPKGLTWILLLLCSSGYLPPNAQYVRQWLSCVRCFLLLLGLEGSCSRCGDMPSKLCLQHVSTNNTPRGWLWFTSFHTVWSCCVPSFDSLKFYDISCFLMISFAVVVSDVKKKKIYKCKDGH